MIKRLLVFLILSAAAFGTTTVSGNVKNLGTGAVSKSTFVRFWLRGCSGNQPRVNGTAIIAPSQGNVFYFDVVPNSSGVLSGTLYSTRDAAGTGNGEIECGGVFTGVWYGMQLFVNGKGGPETPIHAKNTATIDVSNVSAIATNPVVAAPTGDTTYCRIDGGNCGFTGPITFVPSSNGVDIVTMTRKTDTLPTGNFINFKSLAGATLFKVGIDGSVTAGAGTFSGSIIQTAGGSQDVEINHFILATAPNGVFPLGGDIALHSRGSSDLWLKHTAAKATASATLNAGANANVLLANISPTSSLLTSFTPSANAAWIIGRGTPNEEYATAVTIVDATHANITCAKAHTVNGADNNNKALIDIEQGIGNTVIQVDGGGNVVFQNTDPSQQLAGVFEMVRVQGSDGVPYMLLPSSQSATFPRNAVLFRAPISATGTIGAGGGQLPTAADLVFRNSGPSNAIRLMISNGVGNGLTVEDTKLTFSLPVIDSTAGGTPPASGFIRILNGHGLAWRNAGNTADLSFGVNAADGLAFNTAAVVGTIPYNVGVADLTLQSAAVGPTTIRAVGANQAGVYRVSWAAVVTQAATTSSTLGGANVGFQVTYTDNDTGAAVTTPLAAAPGAGTNTAYSQTNSQNVVGAQASGVVIVNAKASTNIQYNFGYTSVGATVMQYALHVRVEPI